MISWQSIHLKRLTKSIDKHESQSKWVGKIYLNMHIKNEACSTGTESYNYFRSGIIKGNLCKKVIWFKRLRLKAYLGLKRINTVSCKRALGCFWIVLIWRCQNHRKGPKKESNWCLFNINTLLQNHRHHITKHTIG